ncbi:MAG: rhodanese-like domain-containing protein [Planctomycetes bacterium]|nr:rhodanese-like domain-containing protein [Planctomycetota bacterium]
MFQFARMSLLALAVALLAGQSAQAQHTADSIDQVEKNLTAHKAVLLDVREEGETDKGYIDGALLVPLSMLQEGKQTDGFAQVLAQRLPKKTIVYCYCVSGGRALVASEILKGLGYDARALKPGYQDLSQAGFVTAKPKPKQ